MKNRRLKMSKEEEKDMQSLKTAMRWILTVIGLIYIGYKIICMSDYEYVTHQTYAILQIIGAWLFIIWVTLVTNK